jgi:hypothetical protein
MSRQASSVKDERMSLFHSSLSKIKLKCGEANHQVVDNTSLEDPKPLIPLSALKWPYVPEESAYPDPLKRDDPKTLPVRSDRYESSTLFSIPLSLIMYHSATSATIRKVLNEHPNLINTLSSIDSFRGREREEALQRALGVTTHDINNQFKGVELSDDVLALRKFAEAVESAVRGDDEKALGLNWDPSES